MLLRQSLLSAMLAAPLAGLGLIITYFLARGPESGFLHSPALGMVTGFCGAVCLSLVALYFDAISRLRAGLQAELPELLAAGRDLQARNSKAVRARDAKCEFLAKMSHELRTPMTAVIGYSEIVIEDMAAAGREAESGDVRKIYATGKHLLALINDVLDSSKIDAGKMQIFPEPASLGQLVQEAAPRCTELAAANGNSIRFDRLDGAAMIEVDCKKLRQIVSELVGMASHVLRGGEIAVSCALEEGWIAITVCTAQGTILEENMGHVSGIAETADADHTPDTILGFTLAKRLCSLMGGELRKEESKHGFLARARIPVNARPVVEAEGSQTGRSEAAAIPELLSLPLDEESLLMRFCRTCYGRLLSNRYKVMLLREAPGKSNL